MHERRHDRFDQMLDDALASYGVAPEREGLPQRILAQINERTMHKPPIRRLLIVIGAAVAVVCCLFWWATPKTTMRLQSTTATASITRKTEEKSVQTTPARDFAVVLPRPTTQRSIRRRSAEPKLARFPTPSPMTSEEHALLRLATGDMKDIPLELTHADDPIEPLQISAIEIKPLE